MTAVVNSLSEPSDSFIFAVSAFLVSLKEDGIIDAYTDISHIVNGKYNHLVWE